MRRTDKEFKEEILRRRDAYKARRRKRNMFLTAIGCFVLVFTGFYMSVPLTGLGGSSTGTAENAQMAYGVMDMEKNSAVLYEAPAEAPGAVMEDGTMEAQEETCQNSMMAGSSTSRRYDVISVEVISNPASEDYARVFTDGEKIAAVMNAIEYCYTIVGLSEMTEDTGDAEGMSYEIVITYEDGTACYTLFNGGLFSEEEGRWIAVDEAAYDRLEEAISQAAD